MTPTRMPTHKEVRDLLMSRLGRAVTLAPIAPYAPTASEPVTFGVYVDQQMRTLGVAACDLDLSVLAAAALGTIPVGGAEAELSDARLASASAQRLRVLLEDFAPWFDVTGGPSAHLHEMYPPGTEPPTDIPAYAQVLGCRVDLEVGIAGYGNGRLALVRPAV